MKLLILTQKVDSEDDNLGFFHAWIKEFAQQCEQVTVICLYEGQHHLPANVRVLSLGKEKRVSRLWYLIRLYTYVWRERTNYESVFVHMNQIYVILCGLLWRMMGKRIVLWYVHRSVTFSLRIATHIVHAVCTTNPESFRIATHKRHIVGHGIDETLFQHIATKVTGRTQLVSWGRISPAKDYMTILRALKRLKDDGNPVELRLIGGVGTPEQQTYLDSLTQYVRDNDLAQTATFTGPVAHDRVPLHIVSNSIFLHASTTGSLDKAALEAMVAGLLVITCNESVASIMPIQDRERLMFDVGNDLMLAQKIVALTALSEDERAAISQRLHNIVRWDHTLFALITKLLRILEGAT